MFFNTVRPGYGMAGCDAVSMAMNGVTAHSPVLSRSDAQAIFEARQPCLLCTVTQTVSNAVYPFIYGKAVFTFGQCEATGDGEVLGAEWKSSGHEPCHYEHAGCNAIGCTCIAGPRTYVGFDHEKVNTCFPDADRHPGESAEDKKYHHCLGVVWNGQSISLTNLCKGFGFDLGALAAWEADGERLQSASLDLGAEPPDLEPKIFRVKMFPAGNTDIVWDRLILVVNNSNTKTTYDNWVTRWSAPANRAWLEELPAAYNSTFGTTTNWLGLVNTQAHPEPNGVSVFWENRDEPGQFMHHMAKWEMRSAKTAGGHGHQACYDWDGVIILSGVSAGTADFSSPRWHTFNPHVREDVKPFIRALQLEGNPCSQSFDSLTHALIYDGVNLHNYRACRPSVPNGKPLLSPGAIP